MASHSLEELRDKASRQDVSYWLQTQYSQKLADGDPEVLDIMRMSDTTEAINWLASTSAEKMQYGTASREERLAKAAEHAGKAGIELAELAEERGLTNLL
jgi:hypothetical protein